MSYFLLGLILLAVTFSASSQFSFKLGVSNHQMQSFLQNGIADALIAAALSPLIWLGLIFYIFGCRSVVMGVDGSRFLRRLPICSNKLPGDNGIWRIYPQ